MGGVVKIHWILHCYPRSWRDRYGDEYAELLAQTCDEDRGGIRLWWDVIRGAATVRGDGLCHRLKASNMRTHRKWIWAGGATVIFAAASTLTGLALSAGGSTPAAAPAVVRPVAIVVKPARPTGTGESIDDAYPAYLKVTARPKQ